MEWNNAWSLQLQNRLVIRKMKSSFGMTNAYTSFAVFRESLGIITHNFVCIVELHLLEKDKMIMRRFLAMQ